MVLEKAEALSKLLGGVPLRGAGCRRLGLGEPAVFETAGFDSRLAFAP